MIVLLDLYGVVLESPRASYYLYSAFEKYGLNVSMKSLKEFWRNVRIGKLDIEEVLGRGVFEKFIELHVERKGFREFLGYLNGKGVLWGIQGNVDRKTFESLQNRFGWEPKVIFISGDIGVSKPDPTFFEHVYKEVGEFLLVDDDPRNVKVVKSMGLPAIQFKDFARLRKEVEKLGI